MTLHAHPRGCGGACVGLWPGCTQLFGHLGRLWETDNPVSQIVFQNWAAGDVKATHRGDVA